MNKFVNQGALSLVAKVKPDQVQNLRNLLAKMVPPHADVESNDIVPFAEITTIHFARFVVVDKSLSEGSTLSENVIFRKVDPILIFSTNYDGPQSAHIEQMVDVASEGLDKIYSHCFDYPEQSKRNRSSRISYLKRLRKPYGAFHCGTQGLSVGRIRMEARLRDEIEKYIDEKNVNRNWTNAEDPTKIREDIRRHFGQTALSWALTPPDEPPLSWKLFRGNGWKSLIWLIIKFLFVLPFIIVPVLPIILRYKEKRDKIYPKIRYDERAKTLAAREDQVVQNQMTILVDMKPGMFRTFALNFVFSAVEVVARYYFTKGKLGSIPTIHFARWVVVDGGKALMFMSNYGGSWESYLGDFVDKASIGLTAIWSNSVLYPRTKWLVLEGATDEERFKCWARAQQIPTDVWYTAYKTITVKNIIMNKEIRKGLAASNLSKEQALEWLKLL